MNRQASTITLICIIGLFLLCWWVLQPPNEHFEQLAAPLHVIVADGCREMSISNQQPSGDGIYGCAVIPCPDEYDVPNVTCWSCCNYD